MTFVSAVVDAGPPSARPSLRRPEEAADCCVGQRSPATAAGAYAEITRDGIRTRRRMWPVYSRCVAEHFVPRLGPNGAGVRLALDGIAASVRERESDAR